MTKQRLDKKFKTSELKDAREFYKKLGIAYSVLAIKQNDKSSDAIKVDNNSINDINYYEHIAADSFFKSLVLGDPEAPLYLIPYCNKIGNQELTSIMLGAASKLTPEEYKKISKKKVKHDDLSMYSGVVNELVELIKEAPQKIEKEEEQEDIVGYQIAKFNQKIKLQSGKSLISFFDLGYFDKSAYDEEVKIDIPTDQEFLDLTKNYGNYYEIIYYNVCMNLNGANSHHERDDGSSSSSCMIL